MNNLYKIIMIGMLCCSSAVKADQYGPYNQRYTFNQQYGSSNWYSSPLGQGAAMAGVAIISGLVNAMSKPDPVVVQGQQQPIYINQGQVQGQQPIYSQGYQSQSYNQQPQYQQQRFESAIAGCQMQTVYDQSGNPLYIKVCP